jgi:hypothetical protein
MREIYTVDAKRNPGRGVLRSDKQIQAFSRSQGILHLQDAAKPSWISHEPLVRPFFWEASTRLTTPTLAGRRKRNHVKKRSNRQRSKKATLLTKKLRDQSYA